MHLDLDCPGKSKFQKLFSDIIKTVTNLYTFLRLNYLQICDICSSPIGDDLKQT